LRPQGAFGNVRLFAAALRNNQNPRFHIFIESGSKLPHSESFALQKVCGVPRRG
jgi:hypothetical protein